MRKGLSFIIIGLLCMIIFILFAITDSHIFHASVSYSDNKVSEKKKEVIVYDNVFKYDKNTITVDFNKMNSLIYSINEYVEYNDSIKNIYKKITNYYYKNKTLKMYDSKNKKILEIPLSEKESKELFGKLLDIKGSTKVKVVFDNETNIKDIDVENLNKKINRERVIREGIVNTALAELNKTGETYWNWYGFGHRVEWCCVFVSWVAAQNGVLNTHVPKFVWVKIGVDYYKAKDQLKKPREYTPQPGDIIFFEWNGNAIIDHVGIVEKVKNGYVYTIEGNVNYLYVKEKKYKLNSPYIYAYGAPDYSK